MPLPQTRNRNIRPVPTYHPGPDRDKLESDVAKVLYLKGQIAGRDLQQTLDVAYDGELERAVSGKQDQIFWLQAHFEELLIYIGKLSARGAKPEIPVNQIMPKWGKKRNSISETEMMRARELAEEILQQGSDQVFQLTGATLNGVETRTGIEEKLRDQLSNQREILRTLPRASYLLPIAVALRFVIAVEALQNVRESDKEPDEAGKDFMSRLRKAFDDESVRTQEQGTEWSTFRNLEKAVFDDVAELARTSDLVESIRARKKTTIKFLTELGIDPTALAGDILDRLLDHVANPTVAPNRRANDLPPFGPDPQR